VNNSCHIFPGTIHALDVSSSQRCCYRLCLIPVKKELTREQAEAAKEKAARFVEDVLEDDEHADEIRSEGLDEWAARKRVTIVSNPRRNLTMATPRQLKERIEELEAENEELQERLDSISDIVSGEEEEEEDEEEEEGED
jgi:hypothetical protein